MNPITIGVYLLLTGWAIFEAVMTFISHEALQAKRAKKLTQTLFTTILLFIIGHAIILLTILSPEWSIPEYGLWLYYGFNLGLLRGMHILRLEIQE